MEQAGTNEMKESKKPIVYLDYFHSDLKDLYSGYKDSLLSTLKEDMMVCYESQRYDKITKEVCPAISAYSIPVSHIRP